MSSGSPRAQRIAYLGLLWLLASGCADGSNTDGMGRLTRDALLDPKTCSRCHERHYREWSGSMHAYASDDPVFVAMNRRGQREANFGAFCVECHAPMAVREGATSDGLNLENLPQKLKGVTCFFCHSAEGVEGTHNNPVKLASDSILRGPIQDPVSNGAHLSAYSPLHDRDRLSSSELCGSCHDIVTDAGVHLERTFDEWKQTVFSHAPGGTTCGQCHMPQSAVLEPIAQAPGVFPRRTHSHAFPGVDLALTPFPEAETQRNLVQNALNETLQSALCVKGIGALSSIWVVLDNVGAGHRFPSGSTQDRRFWVEVTAYAADQIIYQSGVADTTNPGPPRLPKTDPDLWFLGDCMLDANQQPVHMFWQALSVESHQLPGQLTFDPSDRRFYQSHVYRTYPGRAAAAPTLGRAPDRVTLRVWLSALKPAVLDDLVNSGDLAPEIAAKVPTFALGSQLTWTADTAKERFVDQALPVSCISNTNLSGAADKVEAPRAISCTP